MSRLDRFLALAVACLGAGVGVSCDSTVDPATLRILPDSIEIAVGDTVRLALLASGGPVGGAVHWSSSDASVATVSSSGVVSGLRIGITVVRAAAAGGSADSDIIVGPLIAGAWFGEQDSVGLLLTINESVTASGVTAIGTMRLGAAPSVHVSGSGTFVGDSLHMRILGTGIEGQLNGQLENGDRLPSILALNNLDTLSLLMERQPSP